MRLILKKSDRSLIKHLSTALRSICLIMAFLSITNCIEPFEFVVENNEPTLVVQGYISDKSFIETTTYPSDGRLFRIELTYTNDVSDIRGQNVNNAVINLVDDRGNSWFYEACDEAGKTVYELNDINFKALAERKYQLQISLENLEKYESSWVSLPATNVGTIGTIGFTEEEIQAYIYISGEQDIRTIQAMHATIQLPKNTNTSPLYYKWDYDATWIYETPLTPSSGDTPSTCWAKNNNFLNSFDVAEDYSGNYRKELFFMETIGNEHIYDQLSVLITQQVMNKEHYFFWKELKEQAGNSLVFDKLPYDLATNIKSVDGKKRVSGYFDVVQEQGVRWYFDRTALSYPVEHDLAANCIQYQGPDGPAPECRNCLLYSGGDAVDTPPVWWDPQ
ncbi:MAG: hypothetical protein ACJAT1_001622 [Marivirga sp.]|jgi:hypothetical protein